MANEEYYRFHGGAGNLVFAGVCLVIALVLVRLIVRDFGLWREKPVTNGDRGFSGLTLMCSLMDDVRLRRTQRGTFVRMRRTLKADGFAPTPAG